MPDYFYIWMMTLHLDEIEMFRFVAQAPKMAKKAPKTSLPAMYEQTEWTELIKMFSINWWKVYQESLML